MDRSLSREQKLESEGMFSGWLRSWRIFSPAELRRESHVQLKPLFLPDSALLPMCCACAAKSKFSKQTARLAGRNVTILTMKVTVFFIFFYCMERCCLKRWFTAKITNTLIHKSTTKCSGLLVFKQSSSSGCFFLAHFDIMWSERRLTFFF